MRGVQKAISAQAKRLGFTQEDIVAAIYRKNFGEVVATKVPAFQKLQNSYSPVIETIKNAHRNFRTFGGELVTKRGTEFLKKAGLGKLEAGERSFLGRLEKGTKRFGKGVGDLSSEVKKVGQQLIKTL